MELNLKENLEEKFVAFLDVMGFSNLVNKGNTSDLDSYFTKITEILEKLREDKADIQSLLISDSIILVAPKGERGFIQLLWAIRRIQSIILWKKILLRGAVSYGEVYYNDQNNIIVGKGFIRAYLLEQEAVFPRVIIDPSIIKLISTDKTEFLKKVNKTLNYNFEERLIYTKGAFSEISDDGVFIDYANKIIMKNSIEGNLKYVYETIVKNLYSEQKLYSKYVWLKNYFLEILRLTETSLTDTTNGTLKHKKALKDWIEKFERL
jgi:Asp-tRNA(Asn)/Glu-tRNA(Gln) amidotransferase C subunit